MITESTIILVVIGMIGLILDRPILSTPNHVRRITSQRNDLQCLHVRRLLSNNCRWRESPTLVGLSHCPKTLLITLLTLNLPMGKRNRTFPTTGKLSNRPLRYSNHWGRRLHGLESFLLGHARLCCLYDSFREHGWCDSQRVYLSTREWRPQTTNQT